MRRIKIGQKYVGPGEPTFIIAEAGVNHNGRLDLALKLVDAAADAGADAVKFQTFKAEDVLTEFVPLVAYQAKNLGKSGTQLAMAKKLELPESFYGPIIKRCQQRRILFLSTPHGWLTSVDLLNKLKVPAFKIGSGDLTNLPLLAYVARLGQPVILSTGMGTFAEVKEAVATIKKSGNRKIILLHCTTDYPCSLADVNLRAMQTMARTFRLLVGYSDHTSGIETAPIAVALGAHVIEKHLTLDRSFSGPDHKASLTPNEFRNMVGRIRNTTVILGSAIKNPTSIERRQAPLIRKSIVAAKDIKKGEYFSLTNLAMKRPGTGLPPKHLPKILGRRAGHNIARDTLVKKTHLV